MTIAIYQQLIEHGTIDQDQLVKQFITNLQKDPNRGYGATVRRLLREVSEGQDWRVVAPNAFEGMGSMGNGAAMRVSSIGAFYFDDLAQVKQLAMQSATVTHTHPEAIASAIATALATQIRTLSEKISPQVFINKVVEALPDTDTRAKMVKSLAIPYHYHPATIKTVLGNGHQMTAQDTVPFAIWCAAHNLQNFEEALWKAVSVLGDRDTICAIVGGIVMMSTQEKYIPQAWYNSVEDVDSSPFMKND